MEKMILPPESMSWGREVEKRLQIAERTSNNLNTAVVGLNNLLGPIITTVGFLEDQWAFSETTPPSVSSHSVTLNSSADDTGYAYFVFNPVHDALLNFTTSYTGRVGYQAGGFIGVKSTGYARAEATLGVRIYKGDIMSPEMVVFDGWNAGPAKRIQNNWISSIDAMSGQFHTVDLEPKTEYLMCTYRGFTFSYDSVGGSQDAAAYWQGSSLFAVKIGK